MKQELQQKLFDKYPTIFKENSLSIQESCLAWGLQCDDGWYLLIDATCEALSFMYSTCLTLLPEDIEKYGKPGDSGETGKYLRIESPQVIFTSVKEKFATLRIYHRLEWPLTIIELLKTGRYPDLQKIIDRYEDFTDGIIHFAEVLSGRTCEVTGKSGELHFSGGTRYGWQKTLNPEFAKTDPFYISRNYVSVNEIKLDEPD